MKRTKVNDICIYICNLSFDTGVNIMFYPKNNNIKRIIKIIKNMYLKKRSNIYKGKQE